MLKRLAALLPLGLVTALLCSVPAFAAQVNPSTGDNSNLGILFAVLAILLVVIAAFVVMGIKKNKK